MILENDYIINRNEPILITGANGFIGSKVVETLLRYGFKCLRCFVRPSGNLNKLNSIMDSKGDVKIDIIQGNLLSKDDCNKAVAGISVVFHLAASVGDKSFSGAFMNSVVTTKNLLDEIIKFNVLKRFVNVSSFSVYSNMKIKPGGLLDEKCELEKHPHERGDAYCYAKVKQDELVIDYGKKHDIPYVIVRPGPVWGPGRTEITGRVGIGTFGIFLHLGGANKIPLTYVDNCAEAICLAGLKKGVEGEIFNVVDDDPPTSRRFLRMYKKEVKHFRSIYVPKILSYSLCYLWEKYSKWSRGQLPPVFNRRRWAADWKGNRYSNEKLKSMLGWEPRVPFVEASKRYFDYCKRIGAVDA